MAVAWNVTYSVVDFAGCVHLFGLLAFPFGWKWSLLLAQHTIGSVLEPMSRFISSFWLYFDDLLIAHTDPCFLTALGEYAAYLLERARFVLSKHPSLYRLRA